MISEEPYKALLKHIKRHWYNMFIGNIVIVIVGRKFKSIFRNPLGDTQQANFEDALTSKCPRITSWRMS